MDWNAPITTTAYATTLSNLKERDANVAKMFDGTTDTNIEVGFKRWNEVNTRFDKWNGSAWVALWPALDAHLISTSNPHGVTAAQVGAPTSSAFSTHLADAGNPHSVTAAQVGAPTTSSFNSHVANVSNPHSVTAAQVGGLASANNLSELTASAATARSNIQAASAATLTSHTSNTSNPHSVTRAQLTAAQSGANGDITSLTAVASVRNAGAMTIGPSSGSSTLTLATGGGNRIVIDDANNCYPSAAGGINLGTASNWFNGITASFHAAPTSTHLVLSAPGSKEVQIQNNGTHWWTFGSFGIFTPTTNGTLDIGINGSNAINNLFFKGQLRNNGTVQPWTFAAYSTLTTLNPGTATAASCANAINTLFKICENIGFVN